MTASLVPASEFGTDNLNSLSSPFTDIEVVDWVMDSEGSEQGI